MVAVVTGAGSGIGRGIAVALAKRGAEVWLLGRGISALVETRAMIEAGTVYPMDIGDDRLCKEFAAQLRTKPDWLIHAAGCMPVGSFEGEFKDAIQANFLGPLALTYSVLEQAPRCRPVFLLSDTAFGPLSGAAVYSATKAALLGYVRHRQAWRSVEVFPPITRTAMTDAVNASTPWVRRILASPREVGERIVAELMQGRSKINLSLASKNRVARAFYRRLAGIRWIKS